MSVDVVGGFGRCRFALTPSPSPTGAGEGSAAPGVEASHSDQWLCSATCFFHPSTSAEGRCAEGEIASVARRQPCWMPPNRSNDRWGCDCASAAVVERAVARAGGISSAWFALKEGIVVEAGRLNAVTLAGNGASVW